MPNDTEELFPENQIVKELTLFKLLEKLEPASTINGIRIPLYQRNAVWSEGRICALWDSILRGFPLPSFLLVKGDNNKSRPVSISGTACAPHDNGNCYNLLDGQQRAIAIVSGTKKDDVIRIWIDLAAPDKERQKHPLKFKYRLHPCSRIFPFGFNDSQLGGEHDFAPLSDSELNNIFTFLNKSQKAKGMEYYQVPLADSFPWKAGYPVPLDLLIKEVMKKNEVTSKRIFEIAEEQIKNLKDKYPSSAGEGEWKNTDEKVVNALAEDLSKLGDYKLIFQLITVRKEDKGDDIIDQEHSPHDSDEGDDEYKLFERIGRGGVQITPRQLTVSKLMLELGREGNDAIANFRKTKWGSLLDTEDVIHAFARIAYFISSSSDPSEGKPKEERDMYELSPNWLRKLKKNGKMDGFRTKLRELCCNGKSVENIFDRLFKIMEYRKDNPNGFPLVQLAQAGNLGEGIAPITLHPLLLWLVMFPEKEPKDDERNQMLQWVLFANGMTTNPKHEQLNRIVFHNVYKHQNFNFLEEITNDRKIRADLGFVWHKHTLDKDHNIITSEEDHFPPNPKLIVERTARRLLLANWADHGGVNRFLLMWNQRATLQIMYGDTEVNHLPALFGKGRPFDADHILARNRLLYGDKGITDSVLLEVTKRFFTDYEKKESFLKRETFRKNVPHLNGNYRYWPRNLNRADGDREVKEKMRFDRLENKLDGHPLREKLPEPGDSDIAWKWSAIQIGDKKDWESLPSENWNEEGVYTFIRLVLRREYHLYREAFDFVINNGGVTEQLDSPASFNIAKIID